MPKEYNIKEVRSRVKEWASDLESFWCKYGCKLKCSGCKANKIKCVQVMYSLGLRLTAIKPDWFQELKQVSKERSRHSQR